jgi:uncharacterized protein (DUF4415 family)
MAIHVRKAASTSTWVDPDDAPELTQEMQARGEISIAGHVTRRGRHPRTPKKRVSLRLDHDVLERLRAPERDDSRYGQKHHVLAFVLSILVMRLGEATQTHHDPGPGWQTRANAAPRALVDTTHP